MNRNEFLKICGGTCLGIIGISSVLQSCATQNLIQVNLKENRLQISKSNFIKSKNNRR